jgi:hypothetical protein
MRSFIVMPGFNGVASGQTASISMPVGGITYHKLQLSYFCTNAGNGNQANAEAHLTEMRLKLNGKIQRRFSARDLDSINALFNRSFQANGTSAVMEMYFSKPWARTPRNEDVLAWGMNDVASFQLEVDIAAAATGPTLAAKAEVEYVARNTGVIEKWRKFNQPVGATGHNINNTLPKIVNEAYAEIHAFPVTATDITDVTVTVDNIIRFQALNGDNNVLLHGEGWTPQTSGGAGGGLFSVLFNRTGRTSDALAISYTQGGKNTGQVVQDLKVDFNMNAATSFNFITVVLGARD